MDYLDKMYRQRFEGDINFRVQMWKILCTNFFQKYIVANAVVLDIAAGYCEFINAIHAKRKIALDLNPDIKKYAARDIEVIHSVSNDMSQLQDNSIDVAFASNFFEHISKNDIVATLREVQRVLKAGGRFLIMQPNIRYCYRDYWMFFDHITPLDDRSFCEVLEMNNFIIIERKARFLPYTTKSRLSKSLLLLKVYLRFSFFQYLIGQQFFICAQKNKTA